MRKTGSFVHMIASCAAVLALAGPLAAQTTLHLTSVEFVPNEELGITEEGGFCRTITQLLEQSPGLLRYSRYDQATEICDNRVDATYRFTPPPDVISLETGFAFRHDITVTRMEGPNFFNERGTVHAGCDGPFVIEAVGPVVAYREVHFAEQAGTITNFGKGCENGRHVIKIGIGKIGYFYYRYSEDAAEAATPPTSAAPPTSPTPTAPSAPTAPTTAGVQPPAAAGAPITIPAAAFTRGCDVAPASGGASHYGQGVILNAPPYTDRANCAEYTFTAPRGGTYIFEIEYAAAQSRPVDVYVNNRHVADYALAEVTGCWTPQCQQWSGVTDVYLNTGTNTILLTRDGVFPHIRTLRLIPVPINVAPPPTAPVPPSAPTPTATPPSAPVPPSAPTPTPTATPPSAPTPVAPPPETSAGTAPQAPRLPAGKPGAAPGKPGTTGTTIGRTLPPPNVPGTPNQRRVGWSELLASRAAAVAALVDDAPGAGNVGSGGKKGGAAGGGAVTDNPFYSTPFTGNWIVKVPATGEIWMLLSKSSPFGSTAYSGGDTGDGGSGQWADGQRWEEPGSYGDPRLVLMYDSFGQPLNLELTFTSPDTADARLYYPQSGEVYNDILERSACDLRVAEADERVSVPGCSWQLADGWVSEEAAMSGMCRPGIKCYFLVPDYMWFADPKDL